MKRFEIQDIVSQDKTGIVYRAIESESGAIVAIRRFFPYGQNHGGLNPQEAVAHTVAVERLAKIEHPALRSVITGGVDPVDSIPFLVTESIEGAPLRSVMDGETLEPELVIDILRLALEVSTVISHVLGEEAVWVETEIDTIEVGAGPSGRGFTFWISPFKWLGTNPGSKKLSSLSDLGQELTGWKNKLVSDHAGRGLAGWLKWLNKHPDSSLQEALEMLAASTGNEPPQPEEDIVRQAVVPAKSASPAGDGGKATLLVCIFSVLVIAAGILFFLHKKSKIPLVEAEYREQKISGLIAGPTARSQRSKVNELALKLRQDAEAADTAAQAAITESKSEATRRGGAYSPGDTVLIGSLSTGTPLKLQGKLESVGFSSSKKSLYLYFSNPYKNGQVRGVVHERDYKGEYTADAFANLIGKEVIVDGKFTTENSTNPLLVKITRMEQVSPVK